MPEITEEVRTDDRTGMEMVAKLGGRCGDWRRD